MMIMMMIMMMMSITYRSLPSPYSKGQEAGLKQQQ
jgi:hypothetical protein